MIVIVGSTHDDILYFDTVLANKRKEMFLSRYETSIGTIFNQEVLVIHELFSSVLSSAVISCILEKYHVDLVILVGRCVIVSKDIKPGDLVISKSVIDANVDLSLYTDAILGQFPGFSREFMVQKDVINYLEKGVNRRSYTSHHNVVMITTDNMSNEMLDHISNHKSLFGIKDDLICIDHNSSGVALACAIKNTPFITIKVAENRLSEDKNIDTYLSVLEK